MTNNKYNILISVIIVVFFFKSILENLSFGEGGRNDETTDVLGAVMTHP